MRILLSIPCLFGAEHTEEAIKSVFNKDFVDLLLIDNGAEPAVKSVIEKYAPSPKVSVIHNEVNTYVNYAWQQAIDFFLPRINYSHLVIMNSDLIMEDNWDRVLINRLAEDSQEISIPSMIQDKHFNNSIKETRVVDAQEVYSGTAGVFIVMSRKQVNIISPLPHDCCKVWFGDNYIYETLRALGYKTVIPANLLSYHYWSQNVQKVSGISEIIEEDKRQWELIAKPRMLQLIESHKNPKPPIEIAR